MASAKPSPTSQLLDPLSATLTGGAAATPVTLTPAGSTTVAAFRVKRRATSTGDIRWGLSGSTVDASTGYLLTAADPDSGWIPCSNAAIKLYAVTSDAVYEIMRASGG